MLRCLGTVALPASVGKCQPEVKVSFKLNSISPSLSVSVLQYFMLIVMLFMSEFLVGSIAFLFRGGLGRTLANELRFGIERHYNASDRGSLVAPSVAAIWDSVQQSVSR